MIQPCIKCKNKSPRVMTQSLPGQGLYVFVRCTCGNTGPATMPHTDPFEHMDYTELRAIRMWNRENIPETRGALLDGDSRYEEHVT